MTRAFSKSARLLLQNWDLLEEVRRAEDELAKTVKEALLSLEGRLRNRPWWTVNWNFEQYSDYQVYIWHRSWRRKSNSAIWLGVEGFAAQTLFGAVSYPQMYLYLNGTSNRDLVEPLSEVIRGLEGMPGEIDERSSNLYIVRNQVPKCLYEELDRFDEVVLEPILRFFCFYAQHAEAIGKIVQGNR